MQEVVTSIRRVTDLMGDISAASTEQSQGMAQIGEAVQQMDQVTQQNAALVEEMAAAASSLKSQARELVESAAIFKTGGQVLEQDGPDGAMAQPLFGGTVSAMAQAHAHGYTAQRPGLRHRAPTKALTAPIH
jgi:uncharacterized phage infection (PIP) family protein YhgE